MSILKHSENTSHFTSGFATLELHNDTNSSEYIKSSSLFKYPLLPSIYVHSTYEVMFQIHQTPDSTTRSFSPPSIKIALTSYSIPRTVCQHLASFTMMFIRSMASTLNSALKLGFQIQFIAY